jgi:hypothetical protein
VLPYQFHCGNGGVHTFDNGANQTNPTVPPKAIAVAVHPHATLPGWTPAASWITTHDGHPDYLMTADGTTIPTSNGSRPTPTGQPALGARLRDVDAVRRQRVGALECALWTPSNVS